MLSKPNERETISVPPEIHGLNKSIDVGYFR
ncbi:protein of unknown function [Burkholderia multivorans]